MVLSHFYCARWEKRQIYPPAESSLSALFPLPPSHFSPSVTRMNQHHRWLKNWKMESLVMFVKEKGFTNASYAKGILPYIGLPCMILYSLIPAFALLVMEIGYNAVSTVWGKDFYHKYNEKVSLAKGRENCSRTAIYKSTKDVEFVKQTFCCCNILNSGFYIVCWSKRIGCSRTLQQSTVVNL